jgi:hypothetical protein
MERLCEIRGKKSECIKISLELAIAIKERGPTPKTVFDWIKTVLGEQQLYHRFVSVLCSQRQRSPTPMTPRVWVDAIHLVNHCLMLSRCGP